MQKETFLMRDFSAKEIDKIEQAAALLLKAEARLPVLSRLRWKRALSEAFFESKETVMPAPDYVPIDPRDDLDYLLEKLDAYAEQASVDEEEPVAEAATGAA